MNEIKGLIGEILCKDTPSEEAVESFVRVLCVFKKEKEYYGFTQALVRGICLNLKRFIKNETLCLKLISTFGTALSNKESKQNKFECVYKMETRENMLWRRRDRNIIRGDESLYQ